MIRKLLLIATVAGTLVSASAIAQSSTWAIDPAHSSVNFEILHLAVSHVHGSLTGLSGTVLYNAGDITKSSVTASIDTKTISTGVEARDTHLKSPDFFDVQKYPSMTFKSTGVSNTGGKLQLTGDLTLNGVTKSVTLDLDGPAPPQTMQGKTISGFSATGKIKRTDFNFGSKFGAAMVGDDVKFTIDVEIDKK